MPEEIVPPVVPAEPVVSALDDVDDEIDDLSEMLALHSIVSEERHQEICEGVDLCRESLGQLQTQVQQLGAESPTLALILERISETAARLTTLEAEVRELRSQSPAPSPSQTPGPSLTQQPSTLGSPSSQSPESAAVLPVQEPQAPAVRPKARRFRVI